MAPKTQIHASGPPSDKSWSRRGEAKGDGAVEDLGYMTDQPEGAEGQDRDYLLCRAPQWRVRGARKGVF